MKPAPLILVASSAAVVSAQNIPTLAQAIQNIPTCSRSALASAMNKEGCPTSNISTSTFNCVFQVHFSSITVDVSQAGLSQSCRSDFIEAWGTSGGVWLGGPTTDDLNAAVTALANVVSGAGSTPSASGAMTTAATSTNALANGGGATQMPSSSTGKNAAAAATVAAGMRIMGPVVALGALLL